MSSTDNANQDINASLEELESFCGSDALSLDGLRERIDGLPSGIIRDSSFFHRACMNERITQESLVCLLNAFPGACDVSSNIFCPEGMTRFEGESSYPLHMVCRNDNCSRSMIELILKENHSALGVTSSLGEGIIRGHHDDFFVKGSPLHYYLSRKTDVDLGTIKMLVQAAPNRILLAPNIGDVDGLSYPLHAALFHPNICDMQHIIEYFLEAEPSSIHLVDGYGRVPLHIACEVERMTVDVIQLLLDAHPEAMRSRWGFYDSLPMHTFCDNRDLDDVSWLDIFNFLVSIDPACLSEVDVGGCIPLHYAACARSPKNVKAIVDAYPESPRVATSGILPLHEAVHEGRADTVAYLIELYPESIHARDGEGDLPIHYSALRKESAEIIELLLKHDPTALSKENDSGYLPLHVKCNSRDMHLNDVQFLYDTFPESILVGDNEGGTPLELVFRTRRWAPDGHIVLANSLPVVDFLETQLHYANKAQDMNIMTTADGNGCLELHLASANSDASLGSIKLLVKGNPDALQAPDNNGNLPLHHACLRGNCNVIRYLLEINSATVSKRNGDNKLPIHLLLEAIGSSGDSESPEYIETIWRLLLAHPEIVLV